MKMAQFRNIQYGYINIETERYEDQEDFVRITEYVDIEFTELSAEVTVPKEIEFFEKARETVKVAAALEVEKINDKIQNLRALTHQA